MSPETDARLKENEVRFQQYINKVHAAYKFAGDVKAEGWAGNFLMGLAVSGLELIPFSANIRPRDYWHTAPEPPHNGNDWPISWIVEYGALNQLENDYGDG